MSVFSIDIVSPRPTVSSLFTRTTGALSRLGDAWRRYRAERLLASLPYDTLKDIGFPSADDARNIDQR